MTHQNLEHTSALVSIKWKLLGETYADGLGFEELLTSRAVGVRLAGYEKIMV